MTLPGVELVRESDHALSEVVIAVGELSHDVTLMVPAGFVGVYLRREGEDATACHKSKPSELPSREVLQPFRCC